MVAVRAGDLAVQRHRRGRRLRAAAAAAVVAAEPAIDRQCLCGLFVQHGDQLRHQHELAGICWRTVDELSDTDGGAGGSELFLGRDRDGGGDRTHPGLRAPHGKESGQRMGGPDPRHALDPAADLLRLRIVPGAAGRGAELRRLPAGPDPGSGQVPGTQTGCGRPAVEERQG